ncbi:hypothetical protein [Pseudothauera rhizosphaerae]|uniref:Uncharacterized protein n=1 Tax=Pseudothauera rhizosphaerae TaxID=2565932 RepID=A0A4S4AIJ8_9RHOO|nr:hypothetical protein [Pseudothauera rhizosphaerae]THF58109.1 hypothetical protein E6O51_17365 [Pseudothauera rhizosphaerae]
MALSKEQMRRIYGIRESKDPVDPIVLSRRHFHEAFARFGLKWLWVLHSISFISAFLIVLLPVLSESWKMVMVETPVVQFIFLEFSHIGGLFVFLLAIGLVCYFYSASKIDGKEYSEHGYPINLSGVGSWREVIEADLYPTTKEEECVYWVGAIGGIWISTVGWFIMFGAIGFFIRIGGY